MELLMSANEIAMRIGRSNSWVRNFIKRKGFKPKGERRKNPKRQGERLYDTNVINYVIVYSTWWQNTYDYIPEDCLSITKISEKTGITKQTIRRRINDLGIKPRFLQHYRNNDIAMYSPDQIEKVVTNKRPYDKVSLRHKQSDEFTVSEIAKLFKISSARVNSLIGVLHIRRHGRYADGNKEAINTYDRGAVKKIGIRLKQIDVKKLRI